MFMNLLTFINFIYIYIYIYISPSHPALHKLHAVLRYGALHRLEAPQIDAYKAFKLGLDDYIGSFNYQNTTLNKQLQ